MKNAGMRFSWDSTPDRFACSHQVVAGSAAVLALHPETARRLARLVETRLGAPLVRPVPAAMLVHGTAGARGGQLEWYEAGAPLGLSGTHEVSFHDQRGLPVDALAAAAMLRELIGWRTALRSGDASMPAKEAACGCDSPELAAIGMAVPDPGAAIEDIVNAVRTSSASRIRRSPPATSDGCGAHSSAR